MLAIFLMLCFISISPVFLYGFIFYIIKETWTCSTCFWLDRVTAVYCWFVNAGLTVNGPVTQPECAVSVMYHGLVFLQHWAELPCCLGRPFTHWNHQRNPQGESGSRKIVKRMLVYCFIIFIALKAESVCLLRWERMFCVLHKEAPKEDRRQHIFLCRKGVLRPTLSEHAQWDRKFT